jgi:hypothetical protein
MLAHQVLHCPDFPLLAPLLSPFCRTGRLETLTRQNELAPAIPAVSIRRLCKSPTSAIVFLLVSIILEELAEQLTNLELGDG